MTQSFSATNIVILFKHHVYTWSSGLKPCHCKKRRVNVFWFTCEFWCLGAQHWKDSGALKKIQPFSHKLGRKKNGLPSTYGCMIRPLNMAVLLLSPSSAQLVPASPTLSCMTDLPSKQKNLFIYLFYFWLHSVFIAACSLSLVASSGGTHCNARASHCSGFPCFQTWAPGTLASVVAAPRLSNCGSWP